MSFRTAALVLLLAAATTAALTLALRARPHLQPPLVGGATSRRVTFRVEAGASARVIGEQLYDAGLIRSPLFFRYLASFYGIDNQLSAGEYELDGSMTTIEILDRLHRGAVRRMRFTAVEGWRIEEIDQALVTNLGLSPGAFVRAVRQIAERPPSGLELPAGAGLEGYLFPATYELPANVQAHDVAELMLATFELRFDSGMRARAGDRGLSIREVVTLASIVEREVVYPKEMPLVAAVYLKRLSLGMKLDADPTVQYALAMDPVSRARHGYWKRSLTAADLLVDSPYNTYLYAGLPPGPICNPGEAALRAVLDAEDTDYLYFVAGEDGRHVFARTLEEHLANVARYRAEREAGQ